MLSPRKVFNRPRLCIDFDGTIFDGQGIFAGCIEVLTELRKSYSIAIFSARPTEAEREHMRRVLTENAVPFDEILPAKPEAVAFIDDKGIGFQSWQQIKECMNAMTNER